LKSYENNSLKIIAHLRSFDQIQAVKEVAVRQCISAECALGQGITQGAMGRVVRGKQIYSKMRLAVSILNGSL